MFLLSYISRRLCTREKGKSIRDGKGLGTINYKILKTCQLFDIPSSQFCSIINVFASLIKMEYGVKIMKNVNANFFFFYPAHQANVS